MRLEVMRIALHSVQLVSWSGIKDPAPVANVQPEKAVYLDKYDWHSEEALTFDQLDELHA